MPHSPGPAQAYLTALSKARAAFLKTCNNFLLTGKLPGEMASYSPHNRETVIRFACEFLFGSKDTAQFNGKPPKLDLAITPMHYEGAAGALYDKAVAAGADWGRPFVISLTNDGYGSIRKFSEQAADQASRIRAETLICGFLDDLAYYAYENSSNVRRAWHQIRGEEAPQRSGAQASR